MPREMTLQSARQEAAGSTMEMEIRHKDRTVWVSLSGILDRPGLARMIARLGGLMTSRGHKVVLDGRQLVHMDYRATPPLLAWNRRLRAYHHHLYLHGWSDYLKAILVMEDTDRELGALPPDPAAWGWLRGTPPSERP